MKYSLRTTLQLMTSWHTIESPFHHQMFANCPINNMLANLDQLRDALIDFLRNEE